MSVPEIVQMSRHARIAPLQRRVWQTSDDHGFHDRLRVGDPRTEEDANIVRLMLVVTEIAEAVEEIRDGRPLTEIRYREGDGKPEGYPIELADAAIRIMDLAEEAGVDLAAAILIKALFNETRPRMHGKAV